MRGLWNVSRMCLSGRSSARGMHRRGGLSMHVLIAQLESRITVL